MRILQVIHGYPPEFNAGSEVYTQSLCHELVRQGHEVFVFSRFENPFAPDFSMKKTVEDVVLKSGQHSVIRHYRVNVARQKDRYQSEGVDLAFQDMLEKTQPDIVHIQHLNHLSLGIVEIVARKHIPIVYTLHDYWLACPRGQFTRVNYGLDPLWEPCNKQVDNLCAIHCYSRYFSGLTPFNEDIEYWARWVSKRQEIIRKISEQVSVFIAPSKWLQKRMISALPALSEKTTYLDYGFDLKRLSGRKRAREDKLVFGYIGTHIVTKGIHLLIEAFSKLSQPSLLRIWGRPRSETTPFLKELADHLPSKSLQIEWCPEYQNQDIVSSVFNWIDFLVVPSIWDENSPLVIHEAQQLRVPVITSNHGGMGEYVKHMVNGLNFEHRNTESLTQQMQYALENPQQVFSLGKRGYLPNPHGDVIPIDEHGKQIIEIYQELK